MLPGGEPPQGEARPARPTPARLTPPAQPTPENDGLLTASKIATLKLAADWVVLSACNTATGDGEADNGGWSGLAKGFFYAGARSLLVSHWPVWSKATVALTTGAFMRAFRDKSPLETMLEAMPVKVILNAEAGLIGSAVYAASIS